MAIRIETSRTPHISRLELRPEGTAAWLDERSLASLGAQFDALCTDSTVHQIVICGVPGSFCSGVDPRFFVECLRASQPARILEFTQAGQRVLKSIARSPKPTIAWIDGPAIGGGLELALSCQRIVVGPKAKFSLPETGLGIYPGLGGTQRLPRRIGLGLAKWMIYTGSIVPGEAARQMGLVDACTSAEATVGDVFTALVSVDSCAPLPARFVELAELFSRRDVNSLLDPSLPMPVDPPLVRAIIQTRSAAPLALKLAEEVIDRGIALPLPAALEVEFSRLPELLASRDALVGLSSVGKARPAYQGA